MEAEVHVGGGRRCGVGVDGQPGRSDHHAPAVVAPVAAGEGGIDVGRCALAVLAPAEPAEPAVERVAAGVNVSNPAPHAVLGAVIAGLRRLGPQRREEDHVLDVVHTPARHHESVDADAEPGRRRHAVLGAQVILVDAAAFEVAGVAGRLLLVSKRCAARRGR